MKEVKNMKALDKTKMELAIEAILKKKLTALANSLSVLNNEIQKELVDHLLSTFDWCKILHLFKNISSAFQISNRYKIITLLNKNFLEELDLTILLGFTKNNCVGESYLMFYHGSMRL